MLTNAVKAIHNDFQQAVEKFQGVSYDVMDTDAKEFDEDFYAFRIVIRELERRLAAIIIQVWWERRLSHLHCHHHHHHHQQLHPHHHRHRPHAVILAPSLFSSSAISCVMIKEEDLLA